VTTTAEIPVGVTGGSGVDGGLIAVTPRPGGAVLGPQDVPAWATRGGAIARVAGAVLASEAENVRTVGSSLRGQLFDAATALGWQGTAASAAQVRAQGVHGQLATVAAQLEVAHQALTGLGAALDQQQPVLGSAAAAWSQAADPAERLRLLWTWQPAVEVLDAVDRRTAATLDSVNAALARVGGTVKGDGWLADQITAGGAGVVTGEAGELQLLIDPLAWAEATGQPVLGGAGQPVLAGAGERGWWDGLVDGLIGEIGALTGLTAVLGGGATLASATVGARAAGRPVALSPQVGTATGGPMAENVFPQAYGKAWQAYRGGEPGYGLGLAGGVSLPEFLQGLTGERASLPPLIDLTEANFAQRTARFTFSEEGRFSGMTIDAVAEAMRAGRLRPKDVPVDVVVRDGKVLILNTRSSQALTWSGLPRGAWRVVDRTGQPEFEQRLSHQLRRNKLDSGGIASVRITQLPPGVEPPVPGRTR
jgi:hypothetical protein